MYMYIQWTLREEDTIEIISQQRTHFKVPNVHFPILLIHFGPLKSGRPLYKGWPQHTLYC